jgi:Spy/CpxP family protein refolding chaperone
MYKKLSIFAMLLIFISGFSFAQPRMMSPQERAKNLQERLKLNDAQTQNVVQIYTKSDSVISEKFNDGSLSQSDRFTFIRSAMDSTNAKIEALLTNDQKTEFQKYLEERRSRFNRRNDNQN